MSYRGDKGTRLSHPGSPILISINVENGHIITSKEVISNMNIFPLSQLNTSRTVGVLLTLPSHRSLILNFYIL